MENKELDKLIIDDTLYTTRLSARYKGKKPYAPVDPGAVMSFIPGTIVTILVSEGASVNAGDELIVLEAMKMKNMVKSPVTGKISKINVKSGDRVTKGMLLIEIR